MTNDIAELFIKHHSPVILTVLMNKLILFQHTIKIILVRQTMGRRLPIACICSGNSHCKKMSLKLS